jgi:hypothetical protein
VYLARVGYDVDVPDDAQRLVKIDVEHSDLLLLLADLLDRRPEALVVAVLLDDHLNICVRVTRQPAGVEVSPSVCCVLCVFDKNEA